MLYDRSFRPTILVRLVRRLGGRPRIRISCEPRFDYGRRAPHICRGSNHLTYEDPGSFDKLRLTSGPWSREDQHGRPALGIAVAGGTGTGVFSALQSIYAWLCLWKYRPLDPLPVTRFNYDRVLADAPALGRALVEQPSQPFAGVPELLLTYDSLPYARYGRVDEYRWLAEAIAAGPDREGGAARSVQRLLDAGHDRAAQGDPEGAAQHFVQAYLTGRERW